MNKKNLWIFTLFPEYFSAFLQCGVTARAQDFFNFKIINLRDYSDNAYRSVDDHCYGGGPGMVIRADVCFRALSSVLEHLKMDPESWNAGEQTNPLVIDVAPRGKVWNHQLAKNFSATLASDEKITDLVFFCGRYEGIDERFLQKFVHQTYSIGDYVLSGGELAVQAILDSTFRFLPGILGNADSAQQDSFEAGLLDAPSYTRPSIFQGMEVPAVLLSGHHAQIASYQDKMRRELTQKLRPDL